MQVMMDTAIISTTAAVGSAAHVEGPSSNVALSLSTAASQRMTDDG